MQVAMDDVIDLDDLGELPTITPNQVENLYLCYELTLDLRSNPPLLLLVRNFYLKKFTLDQFFFLVRKDKGLEYNCIYDECQKKV